MPLEKRHFPGGATRHSANDFRGARDGSTRRFKNSSKNRRQSARTPHPNIETASLERFLAARETALTDRVENDVIDPAGSREILPGVVDHLVSAERLDYVQIDGAAYPCDVHPEVLRQLNRENPDTPRLSVDEHFLSGLDLCFPQEMQRRHPAKQDR